MTKKKSKPVSELALKYGEKVRDARKKKGYSQDKLSEELGLSQPRISAIEAGSSPPNLEDAKMIFDFLDLSLSDFFEENSQPKKLTSKEWLQYLVEQIENPPTCMVDVESVEGHYYEQQIKCIDAPKVLNAEETPYYIGGWGINFYGDKLSTFFDAYSKMKVLKGTIPDNLYKENINSLFDLYGDCFDSDVSTKELPSLDGDLPF